MGSSAARFLLFACSVCCASGTAGLCVGTAGSCCSSASSSLVSSGAVGSTCEKVPAQLPAQHDPKSLTSTFSASSPAVCLDKLMWQSSCFIIALEGT